METLIDELRRGHDREKGDVTLCVATIPSAPERPWHGPEDGDLWHEGDDE